MAVEETLDGDLQTERVEDSISRLESDFEACGLERRFRRAAYDTGQVLDYELTGVCPPHGGRAQFRIERFVGGGFAGQVYRVRLLSLEPTQPAGQTVHGATDDKAMFSGRESEEDSIVGLEIGRSYAVKILIPPSTFARRFRNLLYFLGYQAHFGAQVLPSAVRVGVLWQKLIRSALAIETGSDDSVCDTYATFFDNELRSFGEVNEWIDGRIWKFEADDRLFARWNFEGTVPDDHHSPEYVHKKLFMRRLVDLLHRMGAGELARQYEWWTCKSTPNVLKRVSGDDSPSAGLTAVDFRAGLTLLPFLPMSPADLPLIFRGLARGRFVQFDRCDMKKLRRFVAESASFASLDGVVDELERQTDAYRAAQPDVTHHHFRLLWSGRLRRSVRRGTITAWTSLGRLDPERGSELEGRAGFFSLLYLISLIPLLGPLTVELWGNRQARAHVRRCWSSRVYLSRAMRGARAEFLIRWLREGRASAKRARLLAGRPARYWVERLAVGWLPATWHRFLADWSWAKAAVRRKLHFTLSFLREPSFREGFLLAEVRRGREEGMLTSAETARIESQIKDPFIQKYLKCLAVHLCTVPVTQVVMVLVGAGVTFYCLSIRGLGWPESLGYGMAAAAAIQLLPVSPGSIARGVFVLYLMVRERDIRNYYIAAPVSFLHVVGYLAFPLQMVTQNPALARFLAGRWTKNTVHIVPVFGESGALLEHGMFDLFFNLPLSLSRSVRERPVVWVLSLMTTLLLTVLTVAAVYLRLSGRG